jgi:hypothetical protein
MELVRYVGVGLVRKAGLEPASLSALAPKASVFAISPLPRPASEPIRCAAGIRARFPKFRRKRTPLARSTHGAGAIARVCFGAVNRYRSAPPGRKAKYGSHSQGGASLALGYSHAVPPGPETIFRRCPRHTSTATQFPYLYFPTGMRGFQEWFGLMRLP